MTTVIVTHNSEIAKVCNKIIRIKNGSVDKIKINETPLSPDEIEW